MKGSEIAHIIRAAQAIADERESVLVGSQAAHLSQGGPVCLTSAEPGQSGRLAPSSSKEA